MFSKLLDVVGDMKREKKNKKIAHTNMCPKTLTYPPVCRFMFFSRTVQTPNESITRIFAKRFIGLLLICSFL